MTSRRGKGSGADLAIETKLAFGFGAVFVSIMLVFAVFFPNPTPFQLRVFIAVLALAAGGVGAVLPGFLELQYKGVVRAGGALALAGLIYLFQPALEKHVPQFKEPSVPPEPVAESYLLSIDRREYTAAWAMLPEDARSAVGGDPAKAVQLLKNEREPLGAVRSRVLAGMDRAESPSGYPPGLYRALSYRTQFDVGERLEHVVLRATPDLKWEVVSHRIILPTRS